MTTLLGKTVSDRITGFKGVVVGEIQYLAGSKQALVQPKVDGEGKYRDSQWFDLGRIEVDESAPVVSLP